jgi:hypothetical protein
VGVMAEQSDDDIPASISTVEFERELQATLDRLESWHETTQNPLYAWEAIDLCLRMSPSPTFPVWCLAVLRDAATKIFYLSRGTDFREPSVAPCELPPNRAVELVAEALSLSSKGKKNAFAALVHDREIARDASRFLWRASLGSPQSALDEIMADRNVEYDRAKRIVAKGKKLLRGKGKT